MNARIAPLLLALVLTGCPETTLVCGAGNVRGPDGGCFPDQSPELDGGRSDAGDGGTVDSGFDGGVVCEPACADTLHCVDLGSGDPGCVECTDTIACGGGLVCVNNTCQCDGHDDCDEATPICDDGTCRECGASTECADRDEGTPVCTAGQCRECGLTDQSACTGAATCNLVTGQCDGFSADDRGICESCTNDNQCEGNARCVRLEYPLGTPHTAPGEEGSGYCLSPMTGACPRPYTTTITSGSLGDSATTQFCAINQGLTTCEAVLALLDEVACDTSACPDGGLCRRIAGTERCTYRCGSGSQCLDTILRPNESTCGNSGSGDAYCGGIVP